MTGHRHGTALHELAQCLHTRNFYIAATTLVEADQGAGVYEVVFDGSGLPGGVYFCQMEIKGRRFTRAMVVR